MANEKQNNKPIPGVLKFTKPMSKQEIKQLDKAWKKWFRNKARNYLRMPNV